MSHLQDTKKSETKTTVEEDHITKTAKTSKSLREVVMRRQITNKGTESLKLPSETRRAKTVRRTPSPQPPTPLETQLKDIPPPETESKDIQSVTTQINMDPDTLKMINDWQTLASPNDAFPQTDTDDDTRLSLSAASDATQERRSSLLLTSTRRTGVEMDLATRQANEMLQTGKEALESAQTMKRELKQTATDSLQSLYETVLALSDSRARHKSNLEAERAKHAREIIHIERAHNKAMSALTERLFGKLAEASDNITCTLTETKAVRAWLGYEMIEPHRQIKNIETNLGNIQMGIEKLLSPSKTVERSTEHLALLQEHMDLKKIVSSLSNQIDELRRENSKLHDQLEQVLDASDKTLKHLQMPTPPPPVQETPKELTEIRRMLHTLSNKPQLQKPTNETIGGKQLTESLLPLTGSLESVTCELKEIKKKLEEPSIQIRSIQEEMDVAEGKRCASKTTSKKSVTHTYAKVAATPSKPQPRPNHTLIVSSSDPQHTGDTIIKRIVAAIDAKKSGAKVDKVRKARNQKVVLSCHTKEDLKLVQDKVKSQKGLKVEVAKTTNPLIIIKDVLAYHTDAEIIEHLLAQNKEVLKDLGLQTNMRVRYRKKARNPLECHPVIELPPSAHKAATEVGFLYIGLQRRPVADQTPLMQCIKCLGFGHTKLHCQEKEQLCSHCGGPHTWENCKDRKAGTQPACINCLESGRKDIPTDHNAFSSECQERHKWDAIARSRITYC